MSCTVIRTVKELKLDLLYSISKTVRYIKKNSKVFEFKAVLAVHFKKRAKVFIK